MRFRYPIDTDKLETIYLWVDSTVVGDTAKTVNDDKIAKATDSFKFPSGTESLFDTIDVTPYIQDYVEERESLMVALYCDYSGGRPGTVQRIYLYFGDKLAPSDINISDSTWTTGALLEWTRPTDQTNHYKPNELSGPILGYNIRIYSENKNEDLRKLKVKLESPDGIDSTGETLYLRHKGYHSNVDSVFLQSKEHGDSRKNELFLAIPEQATAAACLFITAPSRCQAEQSAATPQKAERAALYMSPMTLLHIQETHIRDCFWLWSYSLHSPNHKIPYNHYRRKPYRNRSSRHNNAVYLRRFRASFD